MSCPLTRDLKTRKKRFKVHTFYLILDTAIGQLTSRFEGQQLVTQNFLFLIPRNVSLERWRTRGKREEVDTDLQWRSWRRSSHQSQILSATVLQGASGRLNSECIRHVQHTHRRKTAGINAELVTACVLFMTLPVTVATAETSFSKLKIIKTYIYDLLCHRNA